MLTDVLWNRVRRFFTLSFCLMGVYFTSAEASDENARVKELLTSKARQLALGDDQRFDQETLNIASAYTHIAKGFWIYKRCKFSDQTEGASGTLFEGHVAVATTVMRELFRNTDGVSPSEAERFTESLQMRSLQEMSAAGFFGCGDGARLLYDYATKEAAHWTMVTSNVKDDK